MKLALVSIDHYEVVRRSYARAALLVEAEEGIRDPDVRERERVYLLRPDALVEDQRHKSVCPVGYGAG